MRGKIFKRFYWENLLKYQSASQKLFLWKNLSAQFPATLNIEPTNLCNFACAFCPTRKTNRPKGFLSLELYKKILKQIPPGKLRVLWLNKDGESLLHPEIGEIIRLAEKAKVASRIEIYSNGLLLNRRMAEKLIDSGLDSLVISLDATEANAFKELKGKDGYLKVVENINDFLNLRKSRGVNRPWLSVKMVDFGDREQIKKFKDVWQGRADSVVIQSLHGWEGSLEVKGLRPNDQKFCRYPCNLPWLSPAINWDGTVVPCCINYKENELIIGDLRKQSLLEVWRGEKFQKLRQAHLEGSFSDFPTCRQCRYWQQLPGMAWQLRRKGV